jgi:menaquinone-dependent protoporphyrinogen oxidase
MRVLVAYATAYGATKGIAEKIAETLRARDLDVELRSVDEPVRMSDPDFDAFVIGSAIHAGGWLKSGTEFVQENLATLARRPTWLFSSGPIGDKAVAAAQPDPRQISGFRRALDVQDHVVFGGAFDPATADLSRAGWLERQISTHFLPAGDYRDWAAIEAWATEIAHELSAVAFARV